MRLGERFRTIRDRVLPGVVERRLVERWLSAEQAQTPSSPYERLVVNYKSFLVSGADYPTDRAGAILRTSSLFLTGLEEERRTGTISEQDFAFKQSALNEAQRQLLPQKPSK
jgi:hypothetical protein